VLESIAMQVVAKNLGIGGFGVDVTVGIVIAPWDAQLSRSETLTSYLDELTERMIVAISGDYESSVRLMIECLQLISSPMPDPGSSGIALAKRYWLDQSVTSSDLEEARVDCWKYLDERSASTNTDEPEYCALRAVICVLFPPPCSDDIRESISFFNEMLRGALPQESDDAFAATVNSIIDRFSADRRLQK